MLEDAYADVNGIRLHYVTAGQPEQRPLVVFLHGFPEFWYAWKDQLTTFGADYHAVAPDMRGYNLSSKPDAVEQYRVRHVVEDVRQLVTGLGHDRFILIGHDWGGAVAWAFALSHPEMLDGLVVVNAPHPGVFARELRDNPAQQRASQYMLMFRGPDAETTLASDDYATLFGLMVGWGEHREWMAPEDRAVYRDA